MTSPQLTFDAEAARTEADRGMSVARSGLMEWRDRADEYLSLLRPGTQFTADDLTEYCDLPTSDGSASNNGIGAVLNSWARAKRIRRVGYRNSTRMSSHSRVLRVWEVQP